MLYVLQSLHIGHIWTGAAEPGGSGGVGPPLELEIYLVKFLKIRKKKLFFSMGPPLGKNRSSAPVNHYGFSKKKFLKKIQMLPIMYFPIL